MGSDRTDGGSWIDRETDGSEFGDARLGERFRKLMGSLDGAIGQPIPLACEDWANMKELRFDADDGVWRVAFAFDPERKAIVLVAGDKAGVAQKRFYKALIAKADARFAEHLETLKG